MNIMKTNMLLMDNKIRKDDAGNTTTQAPVPSTVQPNAGMKALMFQGMQNLMANPMLAKEAGVMNDEPQTDKNVAAKSYVAPFSSNIAFQGKFTQAAKVLSMAAMMAMAGGALTSCNKDTITQEQTQIVDTSALAAAISTQTDLMYVEMEALKAEIKELRAQVDANAQAQAQRDQDRLNVLMNAYNALLTIQLQLNGLQNSADSQAEFMVEFRNMLLGQGSQIIDAIVKLQQVTEEEARAAVDKLLVAFERHEINEQQFWAKVVELFQENNNILYSIKAIIQDAVDKASEYAKSLLKVANDIRCNGYKSLEQQQTIIAQNNGLIQQNNVIINNQNTIIRQIQATNENIQSLAQIATAIGMDINDLKAIVVNTGKSIEQVITMSKSDIVATLQQNNYDLQVTNSRLQEINNNIQNNTITVDQAANQIIDILGDIDANVSDIKAMLEQHFGKYDIDMAELKALAKGIKAEQQTTNNYLQNFGALVKTISNDIKLTAADIKDIKAKLQNGIKIDNSQIEELLRRINATQEMSTAEIIARMDAYLTKQDAIAGKLDVTNNKLDALGYVVSNDVINAINNIDVDADMSGIDALNSKMDELLTVVKNFAKSFDNYAKSAMDAHGQEISILNAIYNAIPTLKTDISGIGNKLDILIKQGADAETQRANLASYLVTLNKTAENIEAKLGRIPTVEEFDIMLSKHDAANQKFYGDLIKAAGVNPADFSNIEELLKAINKNLVDFQGETNKLLADILARIKAMDTTAPDYNEKLDKIIELLANFKCECNCQCDCDDNHGIHEGIIGIIE